MHYLCKNQAINSCWHLLLQKFWSSVCQRKIWQLCHSTELHRRCCKRLSASQKLADAEALLYFSKLGLLDIKGKCVCKKKIHNFVYLKKTENICFLGIRSPWTALNKHGQMKTKTRTKKIVLLHLPYLFLLYTFACGGTNSDAINQLRKVIWIKSSFYFPAGIVLIQISCQPWSNSILKRNGWCWGGRDQEQFIRWQSWLKPCVLHCIVCAIKIRFCKKLFQLCNNTNTVK